MKRFAFPRRMRLSRGKDFLAVRRGGVRVNAGPLTFSIRPNELDHARLGLSISRFVGKAVVRNTIKRRLREAFRLVQHELPGVKNPLPLGEGRVRAASEVCGDSCAPSPQPSPKGRGRESAKPQAAQGGGYDVIISARAHEPLALVEYQRLLSQAMREAHVSWQKKRQRTSTRQSKAENAPDSDAEGDA